jgi:magnesium-transporting ATPase (P-type)
LQVIAVVVRTGFSTAKGELVRSILFPKPMGFKFYKDSVKFILVLFTIAAFGMAYCIYVYIKMKVCMIFKDKFYEIKGLMYGFISFKVQFFKDKLL